MIVGLSAAKRSSDQTGAGACPHCNVVLPAGWSPSRPGRCPTCRLLIGVERAVPVTGRRGDASIAAGMVAGAARRADVSPQEPHVVGAALRAAAAVAGCDVVRLGMLEYQTISAADPSLPALNAVLATFGTWKEARTQAAARRPARRGQPSHETTTPSAASKRHGRDSDRSR